MEIVRLILLFGHLFGMGLLVGGFAVQAKAATKTVNDLMLRGASAQLVTGLLLVVARNLGDMTTNPPKYAVKLGIGLLVAIIAVVGRRRGKLSEPAFRLFAFLAMAGIAVAVFWR